MSQQQVVKNFWQCAGIVFAGMLIMCMEVNAIQPQNPAQRDTLSVILDSIRVEATHSSITMEAQPMAVSRAERTLDEMTAQRASSMNDITWTLPGVWVNDRQNQTRVWRPTELRFVQFFNWEIIG